MDILNKKRSYIFFSIQVNTFFSQLYTVLHDTHKQTLEVLKQDESPYHYYYFCCYSCSLYFATLLKRRIWSRCFPVKFAKAFKFTFFAKHLRPTEETAFPQPSLAQCSIPIPLQTSENQRGPHKIQSSFPRRHRT